jgi:hypothetical protein
LLNCKRALPSWKRGNVAEFINVRALPSKGTPGNVYRSSSTKEIFLAVGDGTLTSISDLLSERDRVRAVGPAGERGMQGPPGDFLDSAHLSERVAKLERLYADLIARVERGDEKIRGPKGDSVKGDKGDPGDVLYVGDAEMATAIESWKQKYIDQQARWEAAVDATMLEAFRKNTAHHAVLIQSYLNRVRQLRGDTHQEWSIRELQAIRHFIQGGGSVADLLSQTVKG